MPAEILFLPYTSERGETDWVLGHYQPLEPLSRLIGHPTTSLKDGVKAGLKS